MPVRTGIVIVEAGFGGIGMGIALKAGYHDFVILTASPSALWVIPCGARHPCSPWPGSPPSRP